MLARDPDVTQLQVARAIRRSQSTVSLYTRGSARGGLDIPAIHVPAVTHELVDDYLIEVLARLCGGRFVRDPDPEPDPDPDLAKRSCVLRSVEGVVGAATYQSQAAAAEADERIDVRERSELLEDARRLAEYWQREVTIHEAELRRAITAGVYAPTLRRRSSR